jgi:hypothetical protein
MPSSSELHNPRSIPEDVRPQQPIQRAGLKTNQPVNAVQGNNRCLFRDPHKTHKYSVWAERGTFGGTYSDNCAVHIVTTVRYI